jgi:hypothetical protein
MLMDGDRVLPRSLDQLVLVIGGNRYRALTLARMLAAINELTTHCVLLRAGRSQPVELGLQGRQEGFPLAKLYGIATMAEAL